MHGKIMGCKFMRQTGVVLYDFSKARVPSGRINSVEIPDAVFLFTLDPSGIYASNLCVRRDWYFQETLLEKYQSRLEAVKKLAAGSR